MGGLLLFFAVALPFSSSSSGFVGATRAFFGSLYVLILDIRDGILWTLKLAWAFAVGIGYYLKLIVVAFADAVADAYACWRLAILRPTPTKPDGSGDSSPPTTTTFDASPSAGPDTHDAKGVSEALNATNTTDQAASDDSNSTAAATNATSEGSEATGPDSGGAVPETNATPGDGDGAAPDVDTTASNTNATEGTNATRIGDAASQGSGEGPSGGGAGGADSGGDR
jgi:hypothetical protein